MPLLVAPQDYWVAISFLRLYSLDWAGGLSACPLIYMGVRHAVRGIVPAIFPESGGFLLWENSDRILLENGSGVFLLE